MGWGFIFSCSHSLELQAFILQFSQIYIQAAERFSPS